MIYRFVNRSAQWRVMLCYNKRTRKTSFAICGGSSFTLGTRQHIRKEATEATK